MPARGGLRCLAALLLFSSVARPADDRPATVFPGESPATASRVAEADRRIAGEKWAEALDELQSVLESAGDDLVPVDAAHGVRARWLVHARIAALPPEALRRYRDRVDDRARRWLEEGAAGRDAAVLRKVVDEAFCSRPAERALELLGDLAFERGRFVEAESWWRLLAPPDRPATGERLAYPDPRGDRARVLAKQLMALHFRGAGAAAARLDAYKAKYGSAEGVLGGRKGKYADFLTDLFAEPPPGDGEPAWNSFAGDATRGTVQAAPPRLLDRLAAMCRGGPAWRVRLPTLGPAQANPAFPDSIARRTDYSRSLAFHPLIVGRHLLLADNARVLAFDLRSGGLGQELCRYGMPVTPPLDLRSTLTVADGCVFARLGQPEIGKLRNSRANYEPRSAIVCRRLDPEPGEPSLLWVEQGMSGANAVKRGKVFFEGAPVVRDGLVYAAATRFDGGRSILAVQCYSANPPPRPAGEDPPEPVLRWHTDVCEMSDTGSVPRVRHLLLTFAGPLVVCGPHAGAVVALDAGTGRPAWAARLKGKPSGFDDRPRLSDLAPCVYADGRLYAAPPDTDDLFCLDPETGRTLWHRGGIDVVHLLGVGAGRLIFATPTGLRAVGAASGSDADGWSHEARTDYGKDGARVGWTPAGRGFLAGDYVFWPTVDTAGEAAVHALRQEDGEPDDNPTLLHRLPVGNLVYSEGCLAVAGHDELAVFTPLAWQLPEREGGAAASPNSAAAALALARAEVDTGLFARAAASYARAEQLAAHNDRLRREANEERQLVWLEAGRRSAVAGRQDEAAAAFGRAAAPEFAPMRRAVAMLEAASVWQKTNRTADAAAIYRSLLDSDLRDVRLPNRKTAGREAADRLTKALVGRTVRIPPGLCEEVAATNPPPLLLRIERQWEFDPAEELLPAPDGDTFLTACRGPPARVVCRDIAGGQERWRADLDFFPTRSAAHKGLILVAGDAGVAALHRSDGSRAWTFAPPEKRQVPLTGFRCVDGRLFFFHGDRFLVFDVASGEPLWQLRAPLAGLRPPPPAGRFSPHYYAGKTLVMLQSTDGVRLTLRADTGERVCEPARVKPWPADPVVCGDDVVTVEGDRRVVCRGATGGWAYTVPGVTTRSGRPPRVAAVGDALLLLVEMNIGYTLQRLDRVTGKPLWPVPVILHEPVNDPADWAANGEAVCLVENGVLTARSLRDGKPAWQTPLGSPDRAWRVQALREGVMAYPRAATGRHFSFRWLTGRLQWTVTPDAVEAVGRGYPVVCCDRAGRVAQRFDLAAGAPAFRAERAFSGSFTAVPLVAAWRGAAAGCPPVQVSARGVVVAVGPHAWSLAPVAK